MCTRVRQRQRKIGVIHVPRGKAGRNVFLHKCHFLQLCVPPTSCSKMLPCPIVGALFVVGSGINVSPNYE